MNDQLTADDKEQLTWIMDAAERQDAERLAQLAFEYYHDHDRAERTSRSQMYLHMGMLTGVVMRVLDTRSRR